jgi:hypothetical protein
MDRPTPKTDREGFNLALSKFYVDGKRHGAKANMARALGESRAVIDSWERNGIPHKYLPKLKELTGLTGREMRPELAAYFD